MPLSGENNSNKSVQFEKHQPERRRGASDRIMCGGGCCCCSCCLHSLGGLIGAAIATSRSGQPEDNLVVKYYWIVLVSLTGVTMLINLPNGVGMDVILTLLYLPLVQLAASAVTLLFIGIPSTSTLEKKAKLLTLGRITLWSFFAALAGLVAMILGAKMLFR
jgi:hypothetical protein